MPAQDRQRLLQLQRGHGARAALGFHTRDLGRGRTRVGGRGAARDQRMRLGVVLGAGLADGRERQRQPKKEQRGYSHSIVPGGFEVMS